MTNIVSRSGSTHDKRASHTLSVLPDPLWSVILTMRIVFNLIPAIFSWRNCYLVWSNILFSNSNSNSLNRQTILNSLSCNRIVLFFFSFFSTPEPHNWIINKNFMGTHNRALEAVYVVVTKIHKNGNSSALLAISAVRNYLFNREHANIWYCKCANNGPAVQSYFLKESY